MHRTPHCKGNSAPWFCTICGKHSHFCIGRAQSIHCAVMQHMKAVGHRHVCSTLTNTQYPSGKPTNQARCWLSCRTCYKKMWFSCQQNQPLQDDVSYRLGWLSVTVCALVPSRRYSITLQFCAELCFDHQTVADWL